MALTKVPDALLVNPGGGGGGGGIPVTVVSAATQVALENAMAAAGEWGTVFVPRFEEEIIVDGWEISVDNQLWIFDRGSTVKRSNSSVLPILSLDCNVLRMIGGIFDVNRAGNATMVVGVDQNGSDLIWTGDFHLKNCPGWGIVGSDCYLELRDGKMSNTGYAGVLWRNTINTLRQAPVMDGITIDRQTGYVDSGGILINGGAGVFTCQRAVVRNCNILMPTVQSIEEREGLYYAAVAVETNYCLYAEVSGNFVTGSRIAYSAQTCSGIVHIGNRSVSVGSYAHEFVNIEWGIICGNSGTGVSVAIANYGIVLSGACNGCAVSGNHTSEGFPVKINDISSPTPSRPHAIGTNA